MPQNDHRGDEQEHATSRKRVDGDGIKDLILVGEWMPVTILENKNGEKILPETKADFAAYEKRIRLNPLNKVNFFSSDENGYLS